LTKIYNYPFPLQTVAYTMPQTPLIRSPSLEALGLTKTGIPQEGSYVLYAVFSFNNPLHITTMISFVRLPLKADHQQPAISSVYWC